MKGVFIRAGLSAKPASPEGMEALLAVRDGAHFMADIRGARNPLQHRLWWALCDLVAEADDDEKTNVKKWLLYKLNFFDVWFDPEGNMHVDLQSIAFESMEQAQFARLMNGAIPLIAARLETSPDDIRKRLDDLLDPEARALFRKYGRRSVKAPPLAPEPEEASTERADEAELAKVGRGRCP